MAITHKKNSKYDTSNPNLEKPKPKSRGNVVITRELMSMVKENILIHLNQMVIYKWNR